LFQTKQGRSKLTIAEIPEGFRPSRSNIILFGAAG
jgi:hypothetical protein